MVEAISTKPDNGSVMTIGSDAWHEAMEKVVDHSPIRAAATLYRIIEMVNNGSMDGSGIDDHMARWWGRLMCGRLPGMLVEAERQEYEIIKKRKLTSSIK